MGFIFSFSGWGGVIPYSEVMSVDPDPIPILTVDFANIKFSDLTVILEIIFYAYFVVEHIHRMMFEWCHHNEEWDDSSCWHVLQLPTNYATHLWQDPPEIWQLLNLLFYAIFVK